MTRTAKLVAAAWLATIVALAAAALFAATAAPAGPVFYTRCGACHTIDDVAARLSSRPAGERADFLAAFLNRHFPPPPEDRALVLGMFTVATP